MHASPLLTELIVVREWLQEIAPQPHHPEASTGYWKFTKHSVMQALRTGGGRRDGLVKEMDPDAVNREEGRALAADDSVSPYFTLYDLCVYLSDLPCRVMKRACRSRYIAISGQEDSKTQLNSVGLCISHGALRVFEAHYYSNIKLSVSCTSFASTRSLDFNVLPANEPRDDDAMGYGADEEGYDGWIGNRRRKLWKATCTQAALNVRPSLLSRSLYISIRH
jgi:nuclear pore complex protein Nup107